jgi:(2S)-methylsuccinyl-CoA dehydrogenase
MPSAVFRSDSGRTLHAAVSGAVVAAEALLADATLKLRGRVTVEGRSIAKLFDSEQRATHGLAWLATYVEALRQIASYAERLALQGRLGEVEELIVRIGAGEYLAQIFGGISMSQGEIVRLADLGLGAADVAHRWSPALDGLIASGNTAVNRARLAELIRLQQSLAVGDSGLDEALEQVREEMRGFADHEVVPHAQEWHRTNSYVPYEVICNCPSLAFFR